MRVFCGLVVLPVVAVGWGHVSFPVVLPKRRAVLAACLLLTFNAVQHTGDHPDGTFYLRRAWIYPMNFLQVLVYIHSLWSLAIFRWTMHCRGHCLGVRCGMGVHAAKCFTGRGNRAATACLGNGLLVCAFPPCPSLPLPEGYWGFRAWEDSGYAGHEATLQTVVSLELPGLFWFLYPQHECTCVVSISGRNGDYWGGFLFIFFLFLFFHTASTLACFLWASNFWSIWWLGGGEEA